MPFALHPATWIRPRRLRLWAAWLVLALCFAGTLGQMHRVVHAPGLAALQATAQAGNATPAQAGNAIPAQAGNAILAQAGNAILAQAGNAIPAHSHAHAPAQDDAAHAHGHGWLNSLFGAHTDAECRLYDQLSGDPALTGVPLVVLPLQLPTAQLLMRAGDFIARWVALFDARGPPRAFVLPV